MVAIEEFLEALAQSSLDFSPASPQVSEKAPDDGRIDGELLDRLRSPRALVGGQIGTGADLPLNEPDEGGDLVAAANRVDGVADERRASDNSAEWIDWSHAPRLGAATAPARLAEQTGPPTKGTVGKGDKPGVVGHGSGVGKAAM